ncbi:MAG TPA: hypothetical protein PKW66_14115, partial [Polyangiaceae bacterium]|nr:hypothetical protein [Polyangiaceae bacterium]
MEIRGDGRSGTISHADDAGDSRGDRVPPHDLGAESAVLSAVLLSRDVLDKVQPIRPATIRRRIAP